MSTSSSPAEGDNADPVIVVLTADTASIAESRERALKERASKRQVISSRKHLLSKERQEFGVTLMKIKNYEGAAKCFLDACNLWRSNPVCQCDLATAYLHLGRYEDAEAAATGALALDPKLVEARYTRAMARKGRGVIRGAIVDFESVLKLAEDNESAKAALTELRTISLDEDAADVAVDYEIPTVDADKLEVDSGSDTSDANHTGNGVPCLFYNHQGCARGSTCKFSHGPDEKSVRDDLGKNVCLYHILGACKFGDAKCIYSHSKDCLPTAHGWWNDAKKIAEVKTHMETARAKSREQRAMNSLLKKLDPESAGEKGKSKSRKRARARRRWPTRACPARRMETQLGRSKSWSSAWRTSGSRTTILMSSRRKA
ncbi:hypothetical protein B0H10DRAFT_1890149 [Mycena sp. CBHHK59/15]|nr:hypothetical protein B0H10DRAFT_1890149 [Mycena sp. CBHHK59/15]